MLEERGFSDPRFSPEHQNAARTSTGGVEQTLDLLSLLVPPDEHVPIVGRSRAIYLGVPRVARTSSP